MKRKKIAQTLAYNVQRLLDTHRTINSQEKLSTRSGLGQSSISRIIRSETSATVETVYEIARAFSVPIYELLIPPEEDEVRRKIARSLTESGEGRMTWPFSISMEQFHELQQNDRDIIDRCMLGVYEFQRKSSRTKKRRPGSP